MKNPFRKLLGKKEKVYKAVLPPPDKKKQVFRTVISFEFLENEQLINASKGVENKPTDESS